MQEQDIFTVLVEAREAQTRAMTRFIQARARLAQVEARLQSLHAHPPADELRTTAADLEQSTEEVEEMVRADESDDEEDTKKQPALRSAHPPAQPVASAKQNPDEEETLIVSLSALFKGKQEEQGLVDGEEARADQSANRQPTEEVAEVQETSATDITARIPVIRRESDKPQEQA